MKKLVPKHPLAIRWMHWINFPVLFVMIWSGLLIYWANDVFKVRVGHDIIYSFFPEGFYRKLNVSHRLAEGMAFHFVFMWLFILNGLVYVLYTFISGEWRDLVPNGRSFKEAWQVLLHDLHLRKSAPPQGKYNAAQRIAYSGIIVMGLGSVLTGLAIYKPVQFRWLGACFGGYATARIIHFILTLGYCLFFVIHAIQVILAGWNNFRAMVTGWELVKVTPAPAPANIPVNATDLAPAPTASSSLVSSATSDPATHTESPISPDLASVKAPTASSSPVSSATGDPATPTESFSPVSSATGDPATPTESPASLDIAPANAPAASARPLAPASPMAGASAIKRRTFISFGVFILLGAAAWKAWFGIKDAAQSDGVQSPLRKGLDLDDKIFKPTLSNNHLAKTYPTSEAARNVRVNGNIGSRPQGFDPATWRLEVQTINRGTLSIAIDELKQLPKTEFAFEFKCIEGWSQVSWWGGVKFSDFINHYGLQKEASLDYVGLSTPDDEYYVGIDTPSALHPQTLLCYEMTGQPLPANHGAPLRLIIPVKYGVKNLKRIAKMHFSNDRPRDYWFERGYDYYCGL